MGNFVNGVESVKRFVKVHLHCIVRNLKKDKRNVDVAPPRKISVGAHGGQLVFNWNRLENFLLTHDRPVSNNVTNTKMPKLSITCANTVYHHLSE